MVEQVSSAAAWAALAADPRARLLDVRTDAEWQQVGVPDLRPLERDVAFASWQFPGGALNPNFLAELHAAGLAADAPLYVICRSGARSDAAARAAAAAGFGPVFNVADGFEGPPDAAGRRGRIAGWQASGLPVTGG